MDRRSTAMLQAVAEAEASAKARTPMAWQHRDQLYQQHHAYHPDMMAPNNLMDVYSTRGRPTRTASPLDTSNTSSLSSESHIRSSTQMVRSGSRSMLDTLPPHMGASSASTWDGEPCPMHHGPPLPLMQMSLAMPPPMMLPPHGLPPGPPPILLPPMLRPRPLVYPVAPATPTPPEPLPVREPKSAISPLPPKEVIVPRRRVRCCRGSCIVLWIILGVILVGIALATALRFVVP